MELAMTVLTTTLAHPALITPPQAPKGNRLLKAGRFIAEDLASSLLFAGLFAATHNAYLATGVAVAVGVSQIAWRLARRSPIDALQWMSLGLVVVLGGASLLTHDPRFVMVKPTLIYVVVGSAMLKRGWMTRYMPPEALAWGTDVIETFGYIWAAMMFVTAAMNLALIDHGDMALWTLWLAVFPVASKLVLFGVQYVATNLIVRRRMRAA
jgi:intracellular septation protein